MELHSGVCGICKCKNLILDSKNSEKYCNLICSLFQSDLNIAEEIELNFNLCPVCVYQITLISSKREVFSNQNANDELETRDVCKMCGEKNEVLTINDTIFLTKCKPWLTKEDEVGLCVSCYYVIEIRNHLKDNLIHKLSEWDLDGNSKSSPNQKRLISRRKSSCETRKSIHKELEEVDSELTLERKKEHNSVNINDSSKSDNFGVNSQPIQKPKTRSRNVEEFPDSDCSFQIDCKQKKESEVYKQKQLTGFNLTNINNFSPLCNSGIETNEEIQQDKKLFNYVPFVKMKEIKDAFVEKDECSYVCSLISQRPIIKVTRTPPIKIKSLKNISSLHNKKKKEENKLKVIKSISSSSPPVEISKQLVVVVKRIKLPLTGISSPESNISVVAKKSESDISQMTVTPKKKKRVHFNDTPTIIITDDDLGDNFEHGNKYDENKRKRNTRKMSEQSKVDVIDIIESEKSENDELISLSLESGSEDESIHEVNNGSFKNIEEKNHEEESEENGEKNAENSSSEMIDSDTDMENEKTGNNVEEQYDEKLEENDEANDKINKNSAIEDHPETEYEENEELQKSEDYTNEVKDISDEEKEVEINDCIESNEEELEDEKSSLDGFQLVDVDDEPDNGVDNTSLENNDSSGTINVNKESITGYNEELTEIVENHNNETEEPDNSPTVDESESNVEKSSSDKLAEEKSVDNDDIELLLKKYSPEGSSQESAKDQATENTSDEVNEVDKGIEDENVKINEVDKGIDDEEDLEKSSSKSSNQMKDAPAQADEDFGSLIDEVQKCLLTSTKDIPSSSEGDQHVPLSDDLCNLTEPNNSDILDLLNKSFDEDRTAITTNSPQTENMNGNKSLKRKHSDDTLEELEQKKGKIDI